MITLPNGQLLLERANWGATLSPGKPRIKKITEAWVHHTVTNPTSDIINDMKVIEDIGRTRFGCFPYSFCFHPSGIIAEGGGWDFVGAHTENHNSIGVGLSAIGNYQTDRVPTIMYNAYVNLMTYGKSIGKLPHDLTIPTGGHRDTKSTACPGDFLYARIPDMQKAVALDTYIPPIKEEEEVPKATYATFPNSGVTDVFLVAVNMSPRKVGTFNAMEFFTDHEGLEILQPPPDTFVPIADSEGTVRNVMVVKEQEFIYGISRISSVPEIDLSDIKKAMKEVLENSRFSVAD